MKTYIVSAVIGWLFLALIAFILAPADFAGFGVVVTFVGLVFLFGGFVYKIVEIYVEPSL